MNISNFKLAFNFDDEQHQGCYTARFTELDTNEVVMAIFQKPHDLFYLLDKDGKIIGEFFYKEQAIETGTELLVQLYFPRTLDNRTSM